MIISVEATGKTREEAIRKALQDPRLQSLGVNEDEVFPEVLVMPKSGFLGIGAVPAKVKVTYDDGRPETGTKPETKPESRAETRRPEPPKTEKKAEPKKPEPRKPVPAAAPAEPAPAEETKPAVPVTEYPEGSREARIYALLSGLLEKMGVDCTITISQREGGGLDVKLDGPGMGAVIGRRGETLDAIQHLVN